MTSSDDRKDPYKEIKWFARAVCGGCKRMFLREVDTKEEMVSHLTNSAWKFSKRKGWFCGACAPGAEKGYTRSSATNRQMELLELMAKEGRWRPTMFARKMGISRQAVYKLRARLENKKLLPRLRRRS